MSDEDRILSAMVRIASEAAAIVAAGYARDVHAEYKGPDDPVTEVDRAANELIVRALEREFPGVPIVAEESDPSTFGARACSSETFFVDPLDGTREFLAKNGEFAVMIGLARDGEAALGVIDAPALRRVFAGGPRGSFELAPDGSRRAMHVRDPGDPLHLLVSRSRYGDRTRALVGRMNASASPFGGAGLKTVLVCAGEADAYVHLERAGMLWDACAGEAIAKGAGALVTHGDGSRIDYRADPIELGLGMIVACTAVHRRIVSSLTA
jgi:3'(2'), 5'-bisphosphate nucleotidase